VSATPFADVTASGKVAVLAKINDAPAEVH
jgi:hypothetical protein